MSGERRSRLPTGLHLLASLPPMPSCRTPLPFLQEPVLELDRTPNPLRDELSSHRFELVDGAVAVPSGPGLGVEPDSAALARFEVR